MTKKKGCLGCLGIIGAFVLVLIIVGVMSGDGKDANKATPSNTVKTDKKSNEQPKVRTYKAGQYKVGNDLPAGEYVAITNGDAYIEVAKDSTGAFDSILVNDIFINRSMITVSDGQYLKLQNCTLYAENEAPQS